MVKRRRADRVFWSTTLPPEPESVPVARHFTAGVLRSELAAHPETEEAAELLVSELATNAVLHAHSPLRLSVFRCGEALRVEVRDDDPTPPRAVQPDPRLPGGRGMLLVEALATRWGVNGNELGKTVWFELG